MSNSENTGRVQKVKIHHV